MSDFLTILFLTAGTLECLPDGRSLNELVKGSEEFTSDSASFTSNWLNIKI